MGGFVDCRLLPELGQGEEVFCGGGYALTQEF